MLSPHFDAKGCALRVRDPATHELVLRAATGLSREYLDKGAVWANGAASRMAASGPVVITDEGQPSHVLLSWVDYRRLVDGPQDLVAKLCAPGLSDIEFEPERVRIVPRDVDFS